MKKAIFALLMAAALEIVGRPGQAQAQETTTPTTATNNVEFLAISRRNWQR